jgi:hypothetical protein
MKPPIIANNLGDVLIFESITKAERYIEPIDVKNGAYVIYDSEGRLLEASVVKKKIMGERVVLKDREQAPEHQAELRDLLIEFLSTLGESKESLAACSLSQLVEKGLQFKTE